MSNLEWLFGMIAAAVAGVVLIEALKYRARKREKKPEPEHDVDALHALQLKLLDPPGAEEGSPYRELAEQTTPLPAMPEHIKHVAELVPPTRTELPRGPTEEEIRRVVLNHIVRIPGHQWEFEDPTLRYDIQTRIGGSVVTVQSYGNVLLDGSKIGNIEGKGYESIVGSHDNARSKSSLASIYNVITKKAGS